MDRRLSSRLKISSTHIREAVSATEYRRCGGQYDWESGSRELDVQMDWTSPLLRRSCR